MAEEQHKSTQEASQVDSSDAGGSAKSHERPLRLSLHLDNRPEARKRALARVSRSHVQRQEIHKDRMCVAKWQCKVNSMPNQA